MKWLLPKLAATPVNQMARQQLEQRRKSVEAQLRWAERREGDEELLDLLRCGCGRISVKMGEGCPLHAGGLSPLIC
jgi:hypothetical protein